MRLPLVAFPHIVNENQAAFAPVLKRGEQQKHFCEYVTGLIAGDTATVAAMNDLFLDQKDQSALNRLLTHASGDACELKRRRVQWEVVRGQRRPVSEQAGRLILDDTVAHHTPCAREGLAYLCERRLGRNGWVPKVVTSYSVNRGTPFLCQPTPRLGSQTPSPHVARPLAGALWVRNVP
jgi:hypothetical protein